MNATTPSAATPATLFPTEQYDSCPVAVKGLSYDWTAMTTLVNSMDADGTTNQTIGLVWAWMSLVGGGPFTVPAKDPNYKYQDIIILMSDGLNTQNRWDGNGSSQSTAVDDRMALACTNAKAAGIIIYTIFLDIGGASGNSTVLQNCATDSSKYFDLTTTGSVSTTFAAIGQQITSLRVSQ